jgi:death-on-curing protein
VGGGLRGIRHLDSIEAAIARPYSGYFKPIFQKAAALLQSVSGGHGFTDGNKRTAVILMHLLTQRQPREAGSRTKRRWRVVLLQRSQ